MRMEPISVWQNGSTKLTISDVEGAARFLLEDWPEAHADHPLRRIAQECALQQLETGAKDIAFDNLFASAAAAAGILAAAEPLPKKTLPGHVARPWDFRSRKKRRS